MGPHVEPWLRGTLTEVPPVQRAVLHALELCREDVERWVFALSPEELAMRPYGLPSAAFQVRHIARSLHRLLTYAEGRGLTEADFEELRTEEGGAVNPEELRREFVTAMDQSTERIRRFRGEDLDQARGGGARSVAVDAGGFAGALRGPYAAAYRAGGDDGEGGSGFAGFAAELGELTAFSR